MSTYCNNFDENSDRFIVLNEPGDSFQSWQGLRGPYFTPYVDEHGNLSWTNNGGLPNPASVNIAGKGIMLKGTCATTGDLPADPETGDAWAVGASEPFECYAWLGGSWVDLGLMFPKGDPGEGVPASGTTGQILRKSSNTDYDTEWADPDQADWNEADNTKPDYIKNKPSVPVIDNTLSTAGQAADAKAAGDGIKEAEQIVSYVENGAAASRNYTAGEYITWKGVAYYAKTNISSGASFVVDTNLTAVGNQGYTNHLKNTFNTTTGKGTWQTNTYYTEEIADSTNYSKSGNIASIDALVYCSTPSTTGEALFATGFPKPKTQIFLNVARRIDSGKSIRLHLTTNGDLYIRWGDSTGLYDVHFAYIC